MIIQKKHIFHYFLNGLPFLSEKGKVVNWWRWGSAVWVWEWGWVVGGDRNEFCGYTVAMGQVSAGMGG